jgi:CRP-like cAMP-binding protein
MVGVSTIAESILENPVFVGLSKTEAEELASHCDILVLPEGRPVFEQGEPSTSMFVLFKGSLNVSVQDLAGEQHLVGTIKTGDVFGEMGVLEAQTRSATTITAEDSVILRIPGTSFTMMVKQGHPAIHRLLQWAIRKSCERLRQLDGRLDTLFLQDK